MVTVVVEVYWEEQEGMKVDEEEVVAIKTTM